MDYFSILNLNREPFSNSPDPDYFFKSRQHFSCLQKIELAIRLRRGLNVVIGEVGTGKTTLCRQLIQRLSVDQNVETHLILDPSFDTTLEFLHLVSGIISGTAPCADSDQRELKENIKHQLFHKGIEKKKIVCLIIDEGQKLPSYCIEILREFLNYETNEHKLLQIILFAQEEFIQVLVDHPNFADRINFFRTLAPLNLYDTHLMIKYRLKLSSNSDMSPALFTWPAYWRIYLTSRGYPRKIIHLCHQSLLAMIIQNRKRVGYSLVQSCSRKAMSHTKVPVISPRRFFMLLICFLAISLIGVSIKVVTDKTIDQSSSEYYSVTSRYQVPMLIKTNKNPANNKLSPNHNKIDTRAANISQTTRTNANDDKQSLSPMPPFILGTLTTDRQVTLSYLIELIHGVSTVHYLESFLTLNPHVNDPTAIPAGTAIQLPAMSVATTDRVLKLSRIEFKNCNNLSEAIDSLLTLTQKHDPIRIVAYWKKDTGLRFSICLERFFSQPQKAMEARKRLISFMGSNIKILTDWNKETIFFSDLSKAMRVPNP